MKTAKATLKNMSPHTAHGFVALGIITLVGFSGHMGGYTRENAASVLAYTSGSGSIVDTNTSAYVAASVANGLNISVADQINDHSESLSTQSQLLSSDSAYMRKASTVATDSVSSSDISTYTVKSGESLNDIARKFGITSDTIRWANDISAGGGVSSGDKLTILPVNGVLHTVSRGDTPEQLAERYGGNAALIISFNDAEVSGLRNGQKIVIPDGVKPQPSSQPFNPATSNFAANFTFSYYGGRSSFMTNYTSYSNSSGYGRGWCTDWAYYRAHQLGNKVGTNWGDAIAWGFSARAQGFYVGPQPKVGAVAAWPGRNHVGVVEAVSADGSKVKYSDMNGLAGWGNAAVTNDWVPASSFQYIYR